MARPTALPPSCLAVLIRGRSRSDTPARVPPGHLLGERAGRWTRRSSGQGCHLLFALAPTLRAVGAMAFGLALSPDGAGLLLGALVWAAFGLLDRVGR